MKKTFISVGIILLMIPSLAMAAYFLADENVPKGEVVMGNLYLAGGSPVMAGTVNGDVYMAGGNVNVSGTVTNDLVVAGGNVTVTGNVKDDLRVFGGSIYVDGKIDGEVLASGGEITIGPNASIRKDLTAAGGMVDVNKTAKIYGTQKIYTDEGKGEKLREKMPATAFTGAALWIGILFTVLVYLVVAAVVMGLFPNAVKRYLTDGGKKGVFWKALGLGLLVMIVTPIAAVLCFMTGVGVMLGFILLLLFILFILFNLVFAGILFGNVAQRLITKTKKIEMSWAWGLGGIVVLHLLTIVPFVGWLIGLVFFLYSTGVCLMCKWRVLKAIK